MRLSMSNIAWDVSEDEAVAALLVSEGLDAIDIAPGKYFPDPKVASAEEMAKVKSYWQDKGVSIVGMQALLFGTEGLNLFGSPDSRSAMLDHLTAVCRIGAGIGARRLVFGSPRNRDRGGLYDEQVLEISVNFFRDLGARAEQEGVKICLEPNPACYGANFMTTSEETAAIVSATGHKAIRMQLDTGALQINGEDVLEVMDKYAGLIGHIHASEPQLVPLGDGGVDHGRVHQALIKHIPEAVVSIEMLATEEEPHIQSISRALGAARKCYQPASSPVNA